MTRKTRLQVEPLDDHCLPSFSPATSYAVGAFPAAKFIPEEPNGWRTPAPDPPGADDGGVKGSSCPDSRERSDDLLARDVRVGGTSGRSG